MCGIAGIYGLCNKKGQSTKKIIQQLQHRGNDSVGYYNDELVSLGHTRLAIMGHESGEQPVMNEDKTIVSVANGEIYNYKELTKDLRERGHEFDHVCDTNIIPHLYEEYGYEMFDKINGQFAIAIWDKQKKRLIMARDRFGEKPLFYKYSKMGLTFSSEIPPLLEEGCLFTVNPKSLIDITTAWTAIGEKTFYKEINSIDSGMYVVYDGSKLEKTKYFRPIFNMQQNKINGIDGLTAELDLLMKKSILKRIETDVPVSYYLSGGLDSSLIVSMAAKITGQKLDTFSIAFTDNQMDESAYQNIVSNRLNTRHHTLLVEEEQIINGFFEVIKQIKTPLMRLGAVPMFLLSSYVRDNGFKVALSGEGADELFGGYDIFKEAKIREFCEKAPLEKKRSLLYMQTNSYVKNFNQNNYASLDTFYNQVKSSEFLSSHSIRFSFGKYCNQFFSRSLKNKMETYSVTEELQQRIPSAYNTFSNISKAQYTEMDTFLSNYLLSSQGDRASMANTVECRYPFLDREVVDFALSLEDKHKIYILNEKYLLKKLAAQYIPDEIVNRTKFPYRAMISCKKLIQDERSQYALSENQIRRHEIFHFDAVEKFKNRLMEKEISSEKELMLLTFILSTQVLAIEMDNKVFASRRV